MAYLVVAGNTIPVSSVGSEPEEPVGAVLPAFSGAPRSSVRGYRRRWTGIRTKWITRTLGDTLKAALKGSPPLACSGDLTGTINAYALNISFVDRGRFRAGGANVEHVVLAFDLWEKT